MKLEGAKMKVAELVSLCMNARLSVTVNRSIRGYHVRELLEEDDTVFFLKFLFLKTQVVSRGSQLGDAAHNVFIQPPLLLARHFRLGPLNELYDMT